MQQSEHIDKLAPALAKAQASFRPVGKSGENKFDRYAYATLEDYVRAVSAKLAEHGFSVLTSVEEVTRLEERATQKGGKEHAAQVRLVIRLVHESGQWIEGAGFGEGQDRADKAIYKAITGARKYALASMLGLATTDDPEADEETGQTPPPAEQKPAPQPKAPPKERPVDVNAAKKAILEACEKRNLTKDHAKQIHDWLVEQVGGQPTRQQYAKLIAEIPTEAFDATLDLILQPQGKAA